jgi:hypothetical protein
MKNSIWPERSGTGKVNYVGGNSKSSALFISLLKQLKAT